MMLLSASALLAFCLVILCFGALGLVAPARQIELIYRFDNRSGRLAAGGLRVFFGLLAIRIATASLWPLLLLTFGGVATVAGCVLLVLSQASYHRIIVWWCNQQVMRIRLWSLLALLMGCVLAVAVYPVWLAG